MNSTASDEAVGGGLGDRALAALDPRSLQIVQHRRARLRPARRGWLLRRMLLLADLVGLLGAFLLATFAFGSSGPGNHYSITDELFLFLLSLPGWVLLAKLHGLYERDAERADHTTVDDLVGVFHLVTVGAWLFFLGSQVLSVAEPSFTKLAAFWALAIAFVTSARALSRATCRRSVAYIQNTIIVGAGDVGQLVARKLLQHPEYGINVVGFVDANPKARRGEVGHLALLGGPERLPELMELLDVERVVIAFSQESPDETIELVRRLREFNIQIDLVPRLFEIVGPRVDLHTVECLPLVGLRPPQLSPSSRLIKRGLDIVVASVALVLAVPLFAFVAWRIRRDSPGPMLFRQTRLGLNMKEFTILKFRTMYVDTDESEHRQYIESAMSGSATVDENGLYKLDRGRSVTRVGAWLRKTSLDELPQLINVIRGEMSLVGPRPCLPYETESFAPHHFERFLVPAGATGLWQVSARAKASFGEALDMDVAYARGWSLSLDLRLLCRTPFVLLRQRASTA